MDRQLTTKPETAKSFKMAKLDLPDHPIKTGQNELTFLPSQRLNTSLANQRAPQLNQNLHNAA